MMLWANKLIDSLILHLQSRFTNLLCKFTFTNLQSKFLHLQSKFNVGEKSRFVFFFFFFNGTITLSTVLWF